MIKNFQDFHRLKDTYFIDPEKVRKLRSVMKESTNLSKKPLIPNSLIHEIFMGKLSYEKV